MKKCISAIIFIIIFQVFCINAGSAEEDASLTKDSLSSKKSINIITIQVASLKDEEKASQELARLKSYGLEVYGRHEKVTAKGMSYRIYIGRFKDWGEAKQFAQNLKNQGIISGFWIKRITSPSKLKTSSQETVRQIIEPKDAITQDQLKKSKPAKTKQNKYS